MLKQDLTLQTVVVKNTMLLPLATVLLSELLDSPAWYICQSEQL